MKKFFYRYEQSLRKEPQIWHPGYIIHRIIQREIILFSKLIKKENNGSVLDFGCGKSPFRSYFSHYKGADIDTINKEPDYLIDPINNKIQGITEGSIENMISVEVIEHVPNLTAFMREASRVLKPGGLFLIVAPFVYNYHGDNDYARYSRNYFMQNPVFEDFEIIRMNSAPNDFTEFMTYNLNHFLGIFPIIHFFYPLYFITNCLGILLSKVIFLFFNIASRISPKFTELYKNSFLLFPLQISVTLRKK